MKENGFNSNSNGNKGALEAVVKIVLIVLAVVVGLWLVGVILKGLGVLLSGLAVLLAGLLKFLIVATIVVGVVYLIARLARPRPQSK
ncbi:putative membrane protein [Deinobacterium chartae]|uniref:Putative membrane protein n=1 Tax=Deinobacterium chartae TaxID=521158 RepID=A0A841I3S6_9DEIO|nr:hypothetical protein [Deinobacterium chartae]MBB6098565.1 putative membrane protein [Deinobacterium chartae]